MIYCFQSHELNESAVKDLGKDTAGFSSLLNNNCCPNTCRQLANGHLVFYAAHPIRKGEQVRINKLYLIVKFVLKLFIYYCRFSHFTPTMYTKEKLKGSSFLRNTISSRAIVLRAKKTGP